MATRLSRRLHIARAVTLLESTLVDVPTVIGLLKPVVLLPASALGGLAPQQLEAILAHELAHIRRHDYLVNLLQTLVETVLFYHPAVWWLSRRIRIERENCCDDLAVSLCGDPVAYAHALADLEALRSGPAPDHHIAMAATGGSLLQRVRRLLGAPSSHTGRGPAWLAGSVALLLLGGIALGADGTAPRPGVGTRAGRHGPAGAACRAPARPAPPAPPVPVRTSPRCPRRPPTSPLRRHRAAPAPAAPVADVLPPAPARRALAGAGRRLPRRAAAGAAVAVAEHQPPRQRFDAATGSGRTTARSSRSATRGTFEFTDDDADVRRVSAGGYTQDLRRRVARPALGRDPRARRPARAPLLRQHRRAPVRAGRPRVAAARTCRGSSATPASARRRASRASSSPAACRRS